MKQQEFLRNLARRLGVSQVEASEMVSSVMESIFEGAENGGILINPYGRFTIKTKKARSERKGRNPQTGEPLTIKAKPESKRVVFVQK